MELDSDKLGALYAELGQAQADGIVCRALEELANRLSLIERCYYKGDRPGLAKAAKGLIGIADQIGMQGLGQTARNVSELAQGSDDPALSAALARLVRMGDRSLTTIWEAQDMNGIL